MPLIQGTVAVDSGHMQLLRRDEDHIGKRRLIYRGFTYILNVAFLKQDQFIVIMIMQAGRVGISAIKGTSAGIEKRIIDVVFTPVDHIGLSVILTLYIVG